MSSENQTNSVDRRLAAILFADIVGYTSLMQKGESTALKILNRFQSITKELVKKKIIIDFYKNKVFHYKYDEFSL